MEQPTTTNLLGAITWAPPSGADASLVGSYRRACQHIFALETRLQQAEDEIIRLTEAVEVAQALLAFPMPRAKKRR